MLFDFFILPSVKHTAWIKERVNIEKKERYKKYCTQRNSVLKNEVRVRYFVIVYNLIGFAQRNTTPQRGKHVVSSLKTKQKPLKRRIAISFTPTNQQ